jgi:hypothetical protein
MIQIFSFILPEQLTLWTGGSLNSNKLLKSSIEIVDCWCQGDSDPLGCLCRLSNAKLSILHDDDCSAQTFQSSFEFDVQGMCSTS